jgi:hypothetical protein
VGFEQDAAYAQYVFVSFEQFATKFNFIEDKILIRCQGMESNRKVCSGQGAQAYFFFVNPLLFASCTNTFSKWCKITRGMKRSAQ